VLVDNIFLIFLHLRVDN